MSALILYDTTQQWGWLGELYGIMVGNLVSHFGSWTAMPVLSYTAGGMNNYSAVIYIGSTYGEPLPTAFLDDVRLGVRQHLATDRMGPELRLDLRLDVVGV